MNRSWITGLTLASVAGSGGAFAAVATSNDTPVVAQSQAFVRASEFVQAPQSRSTNYQVGAAGTVTLTVTDGTLAVTNATFGTGWTVAPTTALGTHVEVQFTDTIQLVTFGADLVNNEVVVALTNVPAPGSVTPAAPAPIDVTLINPPSTGQAAPQPRPATPQPAVVQPTADPATAQPPKPSATTAPSGSGDEGNSDDGHEESDDD
jgi:hypothetical protein